MSTLALRVRANSAYALLSQFVRLLSNLLLFVGVARLYGVEAFGQFTAAHTMSTLFLLAADFGFDTLLPTRIAKPGTDAPAMIARYFTLKLALAGTATAAMAVFSMIAHLSGETVTLVRVFAGYVLLGSLTNFAFAVFKGAQQFHHEARISLGGNAVLLVLLVVLGILGTPLVVIAAAFLATRAGMAAQALRRLVRLFGREALRIRIDGTRELLRGVAVFGLHFLFGNLFFQLDTVLLTLLRDDAEVGVYQGAFKIAVLALIVPDIVVTSTLPAMTVLHASDVARWREGGRLLAKLLMLAALPVSLLLFVVPEQVIALVYGNRDFAHAVPVLRLFSLTVLVRFAVDAYALMLTTSDRQAIRMWIVMGGTVVNLLLNVALIPRFGAAGAAAVSLATNALVGGAYVVASGMPYGRWLLDPRAIVMLLLAVVFALAVSAAGGAPFWAAALAAAGLVPLLYLWGLTEQERDFLTRSLLPGRE